MEAISYVFVDYYMTKAKFFRFIQLCRKLLWKTRVQKLYNIHPVVMKTENSQGRMLKFSGLPTFFLMNICYNRQNVCR